MIYNSSFCQIRKTQRVSVFPVGLVSERPVSTPIISQGQITEFYEGWRGNRTYPIDMAGFALSIKHFKQARNRLIET